MAEKWKPVRNAALTLCLLCLFSGIYPEEVLGKKVTLDVLIYTGCSWDGEAGGLDGFFEEAEQAFEKQFPEIGIQIERGIVESEFREILAERFLLGREPDLFLIPEEEFRLYGGGGSLMDLGSLTGDAKDGIYAPLLEGCRLDGTLYALPLLADPQLICVNYSLLHSLSLVTPGRNWTWSDFHQISRKAAQDTDQDGIIDLFGAVGYDWRMAAVSNGVKLERDMDENSPDAAVQAAVRFAASLEALSGDWTPSGREFEDGHAAFLPMRSSEYRRYSIYPRSVEKYSDFSWSCVEMPAGPSGSNASETELLRMGISNRTSHRKEAAQFLEFLATDPDIQRKIFFYSDALPAFRTAVREEAEEDRRIDYEMLDRVLSQAFVQKP